MFGHLDRLRAGIGQASDGLVGTLVLTLLGTARRRRWSLAELKPQLML